MKLKSFTGLITIANFVLLLILSVSATGVLISNNAGNAHSSAALEVRSTEQGFLPPVLTSSQRNNIQSPATGLSIYNSTTNQHETFNGSNWVAIGGAGAYSSPTGTIVAYGGSTIPSGWLECNGDDISRANYADLFAAIGTAWGYGDQSTTFNLPDLRGVFLRGHDNSRGKDPDASSRSASRTGGNTADNVGSYQGDAARNIAFSGSFIGASGGGYTGGTPSTSGIVSYVPTTVNQGWGSTGRSGWARGWTISYSAASNQGHPTANENRPANAYVKYIIKY